MSDKIKKIARICSILVLVIFLLAALSITVSAANSPSQEKGFWDSIVDFFKNIFSSLRRTGGDVSSTGISDSKLTGMFSYWNGEDTLLSDVFATQWGLNNAYLDEMETPDASVTVVNGEIVIDGGWAYLSFDCAEEGKTYYISFNSPWELGFNIWDATIEQTDMTDSDGYPVWKITTTGPYFCGFYIENGGAIRLLNSTSGSELVVCGNGVIESGEQCDDGNNVNGDGCSSTCQIEPITLVEKLTNGGFETGDSTGWVKSPYPVQRAATIASLGGRNNVAVNVGDADLSGLSQEVSVTQNDLSTANISFDDYIDNFGTHRFDVRFLNAWDNVLGTVEVWHSSGGGPTSPNSPTFYFYDAGPGNNIWESHTINVDYELTNHLTGVNRANVKSVLIDFYFNGWDGASGFDSISFKTLNCMPSSTCQIEPMVCGNGAKEGTEQCDDGNNVNGDGCSSTCQIECMDSDGDGVGTIGGSCGAIDNCPNVYNPDQINTDKDSLGDVCDSCPGDATNNCVVGKDASKTINSAGGTIATADGSASITIPSGALTDPTTTTIISKIGNFAVSINEGIGVTIIYYDILPSGKIFNQPLTLTFHYPQGNMPECGKTESKIAIWYNDPATGWARLPNLTLNCATNIVSLPVTHFSEYAAIVPLDEDNDDYPNNWSGFIDCNDKDSNVNPEAADAVCNGIDDNCNGLIDEFYISRATSCGIGGCASTGTTSCINGIEQDSCTSRTPTAEICNGIDDDCDILIDEDYIPTSTSCGIGACISSGQLICLNGTEYNTCEPGMPSSDENCNGIDENCNGLADDEYAPISTNCGVDLCANKGVIECVNGAPYDRCQPLPPIVFFQDLDNDLFGSLISAADCSQPLGYSKADGDCNDADPLQNPNANDICDINRNVINKNCNSADDSLLDCNDFCGDIDGDGYVTDQKWNDWGGIIPSIVCPWVVDRGDCNDLDPMTYSGADDSECNGADNNCNGRVDEDYAPMQTTCGVGACERTGLLICSNGQTQDICTPGAPTAEICNGIDDNCNGIVDDADADNDNINDCSADLCLGSISDNLALNPNQYAQNNMLTSAFESGPKNDQSIVYNMQNTKGCTCRQIVEKLGLGLGQIKKGCSPSVMEQWASLSSEPDRVAGIGKK